MELTLQESIDIKSIRQDFPILTQPVNGYPLIWLDNASTTQKPQCVIDALSQFYQQDNSNVHRAIHTLGTRATDYYEAAREKVQHFIHAKSANEIIFVRGTTEAINLVAQTYGRQWVSQGDEILLTTLEHHSNLVPWQMLAETVGAVLKVIPISDRGEIQLDAYADLLGSRTRLVALAHVSNTLGTILPIETMIAMAHQVGARVVIDGAQGVPHLPVDVQALDCDFYAFSGHKTFAPTGIGVLYGKQELLEEISLWQGGGSMIHQVTFAKTTYADPPAKFEAGTPSIADAIGLGAAIDYLSQVGMNRIAQYEQQLTHYAMHRLAQLRGLTLIGTAAQKVGVLSFVIDGFDPIVIGKQLAEVGIAVRAGHHCAQPTMQRYNISGTVRPSLAFYNTFDEIDILVNQLHRLIGEY